MPPLLYRGVPRSTKRGRDALRGMAIPRGRSTDYLAHVLGQSAATDATSWTRDPSVARRFGDVILVIDEDDVRDRIVDPHPLPGRYPYEQEVLVRGIVHGASVTS